MYARITHYKLKPESIEEAMAKLDALRPEIMAMPGVVRFINTLNDDGTGYVLSVVESKETSEANEGAVQAMWGNFADYLLEMPTPQGYGVIADWSN